MQDGALLHHVGNGSPPTGLAVKPACFSSAVTRSALSVHCRPWLHQAYSVLRFLHVKKSVSLLSPHLCFPTIFSFSCPLLHRVVSHSPWVLLSYHSPESLFFYFQPSLICDLSSWVPVISTGRQLSVSPPRVTSDSIMSRTSPCDYIIWSFKVKYLNQT